MRGHVRKKRNRWQAMVSTTDPVTGKRVWLTASKETKEEAERALIKLLAQAGRSSSASPKTTVAELLEAWQTLNADAWSPGTVKQTRLRVEHYLKPRLAKVRVSKLRTSDLELLYAELRRSGGRDGAPLAASTVRKLHNDLRSALEQAVRWEWIDSNPAERVDTRKRFGGETRPITPPTPEALARLLAGAREHDPDFGTFLRLAASLGARRGELLALRWSDVDLEAGTIALERAIALGATLVEKGTKTGNRRRISLDAETVVVLRAHRRRAAERALACGASLDARAFLFSHEVDGSTPWRPDSTTRRFVRLRRALGIDGVRLHDLRHFSVTQLLAAGVDLATVAGRHGHAGGGRTTLAVYGHGTEVADRNAAAAIAAVLSAGS